MALQRSSFNSLARLSSRQWMVRSVITTMGGQPDVCSKRSLQQRQPFSTASIRRNDAEHTNMKSISSELNQTKDVQPSSSDTAAISPSSEDATAESTPATQAEYIPWYLQSEHQPSTLQESPLSARQQIPDLPINPPPLLEPLLERISVELGMDDLTLLDLRALDPPPALGANLLMIIGTARSEKHLHVSADRLCRWLRSEHSLSPFADGLLGRNELKLKMRRRAKRSRLLSAVGAKATADSEIEEGIRTGWVCVNVGRVKGGELPEEQKKVNRMEGMVGFGARFEGCNVVVQMLTEEKRGEVDLEKLWTGILARAEREDAKAEAEEAMMEDLMDASAKVANMDTESQENLGYQPFGSGTDRARMQASV